jgi:hypothetical protein
MRTFALLGVSAIVISIYVPAKSWAWSSEPVSSQAAGGSAFADPEDKLKELQDKVKGSGESKSGFYMSGSVSQGQSDNPGFGYQGSASPSPFGYSPISGFRTR